MGEAIRQTGESIYRGLRRATDGLAIVLMVLLVLDVLWGVFTRYLLGHQSEWTQELATSLLVWVSMIGAAIAYDERAHLGLDLLSGGMTEPARRRLARFGHLLVALFAIVVMVGGGQQLVSRTFTFGQTLPALQIDRGYVYLAVPVGGVLLALFSLRALILGRPARVDPTEATQAEQSPEADGGSAGEVSGAD